MSADFPWLIECRSANIPNEWRHSSDPPLGYNLAGAVAVMHSSRRRMPWCNWRVRNVYTQQVIIL